ncbi:GNAT family N-acetyltransferase [Algisphaera agarilytica]|uniref:Ribosomal protein S18 acetylase RimI-like enzyme n=1 Tax=Algisphaera agarilytica TaxID=1385975 RepID=A0A7X0H8J4_9BACT|nr:GNAT family N-acetyltransferase [Algisphaera agarilytica]MBB6429790.1 ribosomal protein S18 acetylase RimI-like enzyme [Algisphaera agarilytica]
MSIKVRGWSENDWPGMWRIIEPVVRGGETYAYSRDATELTMKRAWTELPEATFVAGDQAGALLGTYYLKANQQGPGAHVCNCGYIVGAEARGRGVATLMCEHSQAQAVAMGFRAMQFNLVVSTNAGAVRLWEKLGFEIVGRLPGAFDHPRVGEVDALVMFKRLGK